MDDLSHHGKNGPVIPSVVVPNLNNSRFLSETLESISCQKPAPSMW